MGSVMKKNEGEVFHYHCDKWVVQGSCWLAHRFLLSMISVSVVWLKSKKIIND